MSDDYLNYIMTKDMNITVKQDEHCSQSIYADDLRIGEIDHDHTVFLVDRKYELIVWKTLMLKVDSGPWSFTY